MESLSLILALVFATLRLATPLIFATTGGLMSERSGIVNIALEGFMLFGAFAGAVAGQYFASAWLGWGAALIAGLIVGALYALFVIELKADQIVTGMAFNLLAMGVIPFLTKILYNSTGTTPALLVEDRFTFEPLLMAFVLVGLVAFWLYKSRSGLWLLFAGEHPEALLASGVSVRKVRWTAVCFSGMFAAWGGASLSLFLSSAYSPMMTSGRGYMALAALIFGKWKPLPALAACLLFAFADAVQIRLQGVRFGESEIPVQFVQILPYLVTIIALAGFIGKSRAPKALGREGF
ncbi:sugar ABC transporter permease [Bdellovibrio bacteriovorus]|uniref:Sugar ABC transporter permease n=1 Tax=Bdellovibrio bacteriovorus TaxID=959 RepID=A0A162GZP2_BDEBC|nr:ABC transporter permease [Bdellovibrio bacteriovorus]KYG69312.1 sugar ABC transporter permease [Bdellovibrio bacteriovorus]